MLSKKILLVSLMVFGSVISALAQGTLRGVVKEVGTNELLIGANLLFQSSEGLSRGTTSGLNGDFRLTVPAGTYTLRISYVGYTDKTIRDIVVVDGQTTELEIELSLGVSLNPVVISASKAAEKINEAPASIQVITAREIETVSTASAADYVKGLASVDVAQQGIVSQTVVTRGFNNIFSGSLHVLVDNRIASIPSLRANAMHFIQISNDDIEQIELVLGPGSALYGPNVNSGVMHMITKSPFTSQGTDISITGGEQSYYKFQARTAHKINDRLGIRLSTQYINAVDFTLQESNWNDALLMDTYRRTQLAQNDPDFLPSFQLPGNFNQYRLNELAGRAQHLYNNGGMDGDPSNPIGIRDLDVRKMAFDTNIEYLINPRARFIFSGGYNSARNIDLTGLGAGQAVDWSLYYIQGRLLYDNWFFQAYLNGTNSGDTYIIPTGLSIIDKSQVFVSQVQHSSDLDRLSLVYGGDFIITTPRTEGTINGAYEDIDQTNEIGAYLQAKYAINEKIDILGSFRADKHSELENIVISPRAALVLKPSSTQTFRATYNRSFSTPSSNNLWLDIQAATVPTPFSQALGLTYQVRAQGVPSSGFNFRRDANGLPFWYSPANPSGKDTPMPFTSVGADQWAFMAPILAAGMRNGLTGFYQLQGMSEADAAVMAQADVANMDLSSPENIRLLMRALNTATSTFSDVSDVTDISQMKPTVYNTFEIGYKGIINNQLLLSADFYYTRARNFVGPLIVETPNVFMNRADMLNFMRDKIVEGTNRAGGSNLNAGQAGLVADPVAQALGGLPIGIVSPEETFHKDAMVVTYRNFGEIDFFGVDLGFEYLINDELRVMGNYSFISDDRWLNLDNNPDFNIYLNAPQNKGMFGVGYAGLRNGFSAGARARYIQGFVIESGIYNTRDASGTHIPLDDYVIVDLNASYKIKQIRGLTASLQVYNLLDNQKPQFAGTPDIGRLSLFGLSYNF